MSHKDNISNIVKDILDASTGDIESDRNLYELIYPFGKYEIKVLIDQYGTFKGINEIKINKDFRTITQKIESTGYLDVDNIYKEE